MVCFDMDGTLLDGEFLDTLAAEAGVGEEVARITALAMGGSLDFEEAVRKRLQLLRGFPVSRIEQIVDSFPLMPGAEEAVRRLKQEGFVTGLITGGFSLAAERVSRRLGLDFFIANDIGADGGRLDGGFTLRVNGNKGELVRRTAGEMGCPFVFAVGDGANDIAMLEAADVGIAFCAKPVVEAHAARIVREKDLMAVLGIIRGSI